MFYDKQDHAVWSILYTRQLGAIERCAYRNFLTGLQQLNLTSHHIPAFEQINTKLKTLTGWTIYTVPGLIPNSEFFQHMYQQQFGSTNWLRNMEQLDYLEQPDMFHDVFGHIPLLTDPVIANYLQQLAAIAIQHLYSEEIIEAIARLYWYTIEFGLIKADDEIKIYGAGILSSIGETAYCLSDKATHLPFDLDTILNTPYIKDNFQQQYFVIDSLEQLTEAVAQLPLKINIHEAV